MGNNELFKGQTDGIILFILSKANRHTDELKQIIDEKFSTVKIGTLYSIIARLKTQKLITEYRASSLDGSRRKYYQITDSGKVLFNKKYKDLFAGIYIEEPETTTPPVFEEKQDINEPIVEEKAEIKVDEPIINDPASDYASFINPNSSDETIENIDFSAFEEVKQETETINAPINEETPQETVKEETKSEFIPYLKPTVLSSTTDNEVVSQQNFLDKDYDSVVNSEYDYKNVLDKLYPKPKVQKVEIYDETQELIQEKEDFKENSANWNDVYELAEKDGIKIKISSDTNRFQGSKILINKLNLLTSLITLGAVLLTYVILTAFLSNVAFNGAQFVTLLGVFGGISAILLIVFAISPHNKIKDLPRFINVIEIALIITISTIIVCFALSAIRVG